MLLGMCSREIILLLCVWPFAEPRGGLGFRIQFNWHLCFFLSQNSYILVSWDSQHTNPLVYPISPLSSRKTHTDCSKYLTDTSCPKVLHVSHTLPPHRSWRYIHHHNTCLHNRSYHWRRSRHRWDMDDLDRTYNLVGG